MKTRMILLLFVACWLAACGGQSPDAATQTLDSLQKVDDHLFVMTYLGDYEFKDFLQTGLAANDRFLVPATAAWACTGFVGQDEAGRPLVGRNFDWRNQAALLLYTDSSDGYASVSLVDIAYLGYNAQGDTWQDEQRLLEAPYWPFDGMNEAGLAVTMMAVPYADTGVDSEKVTLDSLQIIRLLLDYAQDVDEAVVLMQNYNIDFGNGPPLHYFIADAGGNSAVIELTPDEMIVLHPEKAWQVSTNFLLHQEQPEGANSTCRRYNTAFETLEQVGGKLSPEEAMSLLADVSQGNTMWSVVYGLQTGDIQLAVGRDYDDVHEFHLDMQE